MLSSESEWSPPLSEPYYFQFPDGQLHRQKSKVHAHVVSLGDGSYTCSDDGDDMYEGKEH